VTVAQEWQNGEELKRIAFLWAQRIKVSPLQIQLRKMRSKWASMSTNGRLTLNTDLLEMPRNLGEFVIVHELVHLLTPSHGKLFKSFMHLYLPDWREREKQLQSYNEIAHN